VNPSENLAERPTLLPGNETVLVEQNDWSEERNINPYAVFDKPPAMLQTDGVYSARASLQINDPLAQTFSSTQNQVISSIGLQFTARDPSIPVTVQIRGVTTGLPNGVVFAEKVLAPNEISLSGETRIRFDDPFYAEANTSYSVVLLTNSTNYKVRTATLGKMGRWGIITRQTYMEGVLLESSNAETWTPLNGSDLAMKIYGYNFQSEGMIRDHALGLLENLHQRLARLERTSKLPADEAEAFTALLARMRADESRNLELHASLITSDTASG
jgi:hypothetical protein